MTLIELFRRADNWGKFRIGALVAFLILCILAGGASRANEPLQLVVRLGAVAVLALSAYDFGSRRGHDLGVPLLLFGAMGLLVLVQLVPMPPELHAALPGRAPYLEAIRAAGAADRWHPLTLTPDMTVNSFLSLLPALAVLASLSVQPPEVRPALLPVLITGIMLSGVMGLTQLSSGGGAIYLHGVTNEGFPVGFFANRNHQSLALATAIPMLAAWGGASARDGSGSWYRFGAAMILTVLILPLILVAGSRSGFLLGMGVLLPAFTLFGWDRWKELATRAKGAWAPLRFVPLLAAAGVIGITIALSRATSIERLLSVDNSRDQRFSNLAAMVEMVKDSFPCGFGFGSFESVFRSYEPFESLDATFFNHAHNDYMELAIEGGLPAILILLAVAAWTAWKALQAWRTGTMRNVPTPYGRLGSILLVMILIGSVVDYPLRTPFFSTFFAIILSWMASVTTGAARQRQGAFQPG